MAATLGTLAAAVAAPDGRAAFLEAEGPSTLLELLDGRSSQVKSPPATAQCPAHSPQMASLLFFPPTSGQHLLDMSVLWRWSVLSYLSLIH